MYTIANKAGMLIVLDLSDVIVVLTTLVVVVIVVMTHYEGLHFFTQWMTRNSLKPLDALTRISWKAPGNTLMPYYGIHYPQYGACQ